MRSHLSNPGQSKLTLICKDHHHLSSSSPMKSQKLCQWMPPLSSCTTISTMGISPQNASKPWPSMASCPDAWPTVQSQTAKPASTARPPRNQRQREGGTSPSCSTGRVHLSQPDDLANPRACCPNVRQTNLQEVPPCSYLH